VARRAESGSGVLGEGAAKAAKPPPHQLRGLGSAVSGAPATKRFFAFLRAQNGSPVAF